MFRLAGFVIGSAISIVAIVIMVGTPEFHLDDGPEAAERYEEAIRKLKEKRHTPGQETRQAELPVDEQNRMRKLHGQIAAEPDAEKLQ